LANDLNFAQSSCQSNHSSLLLMKNKLETTVDKEEKIKTGYKNRHVQLKTHNDNHNWG